jgi:hypothetical protein
MGANKAKIFSAATIRLQIEASLARKLPSALTPAQKVIRPVALTGVPEMDGLLKGGFARGCRSFQRQKTREGTIRCSCRYRQLVAICQAIQSLPSSPKCRR